MFLTEQQIQSREDKFIEMVELLGVEMYESIDESYELTEEDMEAASAMMEFFVENYKDFSLQEAAYVSMTGQDPNAVLIEAYIEAVLDESIGGVVANVVHGIHNLLTKHKAKQAASAHASAKAHSGVVKKKMQAAGKAASKATGLKGTFKKAKAGALEKRHEKAVDKEVAAKNAHTAAEKEHHAGLKKHAELKHKIDAHVQKAKDKVKSGVERVVSAAGRAAGHFA